jgi:DNA polymerase-3 subunit delta'
MYNVVFNPAANPVNKDCPVSFENIVGHEKPKAMMERALKAGRLPHALLFEGPRGVGKTAFALALARRLLCGGSKTAACDCRNCRRILHSNHPGVKVISLPQGKQKIPTELIRDEVIKMFAFKSMEPGWRVVIINESEKMSKEAANVLLKTLEEPPGESLIVLECAGADAVIETLVSRCQRVRFAPLDEVDVAAHLGKTRGVGGEEALTLARLSGGSIGEAVRFYEEGILAAKNAFLDCLLAADRDSLYAAGEELGAMVTGETTEERRAAARSMFDMLQLYFRDHLVRRIDGSRRMFHADRAELARGAPASGLNAERLIQSTLEARRLMDENTNMKLVFEHLVKDYVEVGRV